MSTTKYKKILVALSYTETQKYSHTNENLLIKSYHRNRQPEVISKITSSNFENSQDLVGVPSEEFY